MGVGEDFQKSAICSSFSGTLELHCKFRYCRKMSSSVCHLSSSVTRVVTRRNSKGVPSIGRLKLCWSSLRLPNHSHCIVHIYVTSRHTRAGRTNHRCIRRHDQLSRWAIHCQVPIAIGWTVQLISWDFRSKNNKTNKWFFAGIFGRSVLPALCVPGQRFRLLLRAHFSHHQTSEQGCQWTHWT